MKNTYFNYQTISEYEDQCKKLEQDLMLLVSGDCNEQEILEYSIILFKSALGYYGEDKQMLFWGYDEPSNMPSDCRVYYLYKPTYLATCFLMQAWMQFEKVRAFKPLGAALHNAMNACMGRAFTGHGYDAEEGLVDTMTLFAKADVDSFIKRYPQMNTEFNEMFRDALKYFSDENSRNWSAAVWGLSANYRTMAQTTMQIFKSRNKEI